MKEKELWKSIKGYECYEISNLAQVRSVGFNTKNNQASYFKKGRILKQWDITGYNAVTVHDKGKKRHFLVHRLIGIYFIPNPENKPQINHKNGNRKDNRIENLEWVTNYENQLHGNNVLGSDIFFKKGQDSCMAKLKECQVLEIRKIRAENKLSEYKIAAMFGVSRGAINNILRRQSWTHI